MADRPRILPIGHLEADPETGKPRIAGLKVKVALLAMFIDDPEWPMELICRNFDLTPAQVYAAWSYYSDHQEEIDRSMREADERIEKIARPTSDLPGYDEFMAKFKD